MTGKQFKYANNWIIPRPHQISYNYDWSYGNNANTQQVDNNKKPEETEVSDAPPTTTKRTVNKVVYKHPPSGVGKFHKKIGNVNIDAQWSYDYSSDGSSSSSNTTKKPSSATTDTAIPDESTTIATTTTDRDLDENEEE